MARETFGVLLGTSMVDLLTASAGVDTIVMPPQVTLIPGETEATVVDLERIVAADADAAMALASDVEVAPGDPASPLRGPLLLKPLDRLRGRAGAAGVAVITGWIEELEQ